MKRLFYFLFLCVASVTGYAQQVVASGIVTDAADGFSMPGVSVKVQNTVIATVTNVNGKYTINAKLGDVLTFSFLGKIIQHISVPADGIIDVVLHDDTKALDEVVVVGYGTMKKRDLSGAIAQVSADDILAGNPTNSINQAMQGKIAGVVVSQNDGAPGAGISIQIRGTNSFSTSSQPLYIVDGIPFDVAGMPSTGGAANENNNQTANPLALINPHNIKSIEILKDASATAIYGSRGANGVVLITTKRGESGNEKIEVSTNVSISQVSKRLKVLGAYDYANYINEQAINDAYYFGTSYTRLPYPGEWAYNYDTKNNIIPSSGRYEPKPEDFLNPRTIYDSYGNSHFIQGTDWQDEIFQTGYTQEYNIRVSGGSENGWHSFSGNYTNQTGIIVGSDYKRYNLATNLGRKVHKWIEIGTNISYTNSITDFTKSNSYDYSIIRSALIFPSTQNRYMEASAVDELGWLAANPYVYVTTAKDQLTTNSVFTANYAELTFTDWLKFRQNVGISYSANNRDTYYGRHTQEGREPANGVAGQSDNWWQGITAESILTFDKKFGVHQLNAMAGFTYEEGNYGSKSITVRNFPSDLTEAYNLSAGLDPQTPTSGRGKTKLVSLLGRVNYVLLDKYIATVSFRRDGSSKFVDGNKFANFASAALAWRISEEEFIKNLNIFSNLKLRLSYGQTGNQGIDAYRTLQVLAAHNYPLGGSLASGYAEDTWRGPLNPDLRWETTDQYNAGIDFGFLDNRISVIIDYYYKKTHDLLQSVKIPTSTGFGNKLINFGEVTNEGLELSGNFNILTGDFKWDLNANISFNRNTIGGLEADQFANRLWYNADQAFIQRNGLPIGAIYGFVEDGFYDNEAEVRAEKAYKQSPDAIVKGMVGEIKYRDLDGNGVIDDADRTIIGNTNPDFIYGLTNNLSWKGFTLSIFFQGSYGNDMFNGNLLDGVKLANIGNITQSAYDTRWTPENTAGAQWPKATNGYDRVWKISNRYVEDGSYLRLKNLTLGYTIPSKIKGIESIYVYGSASNLFTITNYSWYDPDVNSLGNDPSRRGVDIYSYPSSRSYSLGFKITF
jgi:TonB-linked SusC/RagA family outer membrane protein